MKSISKTHARKTLSLLKSHVECKICYNDMTESIWQCKNGHIVCNNCKFKCRNCPYCRGETTLNIRNIIMEELLQNFVVKCANIGCKFKCVNSKMSVHSKECKFKLVKCKFCNEYIQPTTSSLIAHIQSKHGGTVTTDYPCRITFVHELGMMSSCLIWNPRIIRTDDFCILIIVQCSATNYTASVYSLDDYGHMLKPSVTLEILSECCTTVSHVKRIPNFGNEKHSTHILFDKNNADIVDGKKKFTLFIR